MKDNFSDILECLIHNKNISFVEKEISAKTILLYEGDVADNIFYIKKGILRLWNNNDGKDVSLQFFFEGDVVASFESFYNETPSMYSIESIENSVIIVIPKKRVMELIQNDQTLEKNMYKMIALRFIDYTNYFLSRIKEKPEERYKSLLKKEPQVVSRVPDYYLASYLGITPVSLSRIKNRIK